MTEQRTIVRETITDDDAEHRAALQDATTVPVATTTEVATTEAATATRNPHGDEEVGGAVGGGVVGAVIGAVVGGPVGAVIGGAVGATAGATAGAIDTRVKEESVVVTREIRRS